MDRKQSKGFLIPACREALLYLLSVACPAKLIVQLFFAAAIGGLCLCADTMAAFRGLPGENILPNASFEAWNDPDEPEGWTAKTDRGACGADDAFFALGAKSVRLSIPKGPASVMLMSKPAPVVAEMYYVRFAFRIEGLTNTKSYGGGQADMRLLWQDAQGRTLRQDYVEWSYFPLEWSYRDRFYNPPKNARQVQALLAISGNKQMHIPSTAWFDDVALCPYDAPKGVGENVIKEWSATAGRDILRVKGAPAWFYLAGIEGKERAQAKRVRDADATLGAALHARPGVPKGIVWHSPYTLEQPPGLYRVFYRIKARKSPLTKAPIATLDVISSDSGHRGSRSVRWTDFCKPGQYEDIWFDFTKRTSGWIAIRVATQGKDAEFYLDHVRVVQLKRFIDHDLLSWYPATAGLMGANPSLERGERGVKALLVEGLHAERFRIREALREAPDCEAVACPYSCVQGGSRIEGYPTSWRQLRRYGVVVFANASVSGLGPEQRYQLREFVRLGGGLLLMGGKVAFGAGGVRDSFIEDVLPVRASHSRFDIIAADEPIERGTSVIAALGNWPTGLFASYVHRVRLQKGADEVLKVGENPVLSLATAGKGRAACFTATPYGQSGGGQTFYADSDVWPRFLRRLIKWLAKL